MYIRLKTALELVTALESTMPEVSGMIRSLTREAAEQYSTGATLSTQVSGAAGYVTKKNTYDDVQRALGD